MKKNRKRKFLIYFFLLLPIFLFVGLGFASRLSFFKIKNINVEEAKAINATDIKDYISESLSGKYFYLYNKNNILIYPKNKIETNFTNVFPRSYSLHIKLNKKFEIDASVSERAPFVLWCGEREVNSDEWDGTNEDKLAENCYLADKTGFIFGSAPEYSGVVYPKIYSKIPYLEENEPPVSKYIYDKDEFLAIAEYIDFIQKNNIQIAKVFNVEKHYYVFTANSLDRRSVFEIKISTNQDPQEIKKNFENALAGSSLGKLKSNNFSNLKYIDLRFDDKILYK